MPQLDVSTFLPQVVWLVITFTALFLLMWRVAVPRIADVLEARQRRIEDNLDKAQEWYRRAAKKGDPRALRNLANLNPTAAPPLSILPAGGARPASRW